MNSDGAAAWSGGDEHPPPAASARSEREAPSDNADGADHYDVVGHLAVLGERLRAVESEILAAITDVLTGCETSDRAANLAYIHGHRRPAALVEDVLGVSSRTAHQLIQVARGIGSQLSLTGQPIPPDFACVGAAVESGAIGAETAAVIVGALGPVISRADADEFAIAEEALVQMATGTTPSGPGAGERHSCDLVRAAAKVWVARIDPDGIEPEAERAHRERSFWIAKRGRRGLHSVGGHVPTELAMRFHAARDALMKHANSADVDPCTADPRDEAPLAVGTASIESSNGIPAIDPTTAAESDVISALDDRRTPEQLGADLLAAMLTAFASSDTFASPPAVLVTIGGTIEQSFSARRDTRGDALGAVREVDHTMREADHTEREANDAVLLTDRIGMIGDEPLARSSVSRIACDAGVQPAWLAENGRLIALETPTRFFTKHQRRAMVARDGPTCLIRNCSVPASACEAHHVVPAADGGPTHVDNGVLLCWAHHRMMELRYWVITMRDGVPTARRNPMQRPHYVRRM